MTTTVERSDFDFVQGLVKERAAIVLEPGKEYLIESRLGPVARTSGKESVSALLRSVRAEPRGELAEAVVEAMTTNETSFFRDVTPFEIMSKELLPVMLEKRAARQSLKIWCGACSSGQEPYSIAINLLESAPQLANWQVEIESTDINRQMVERTLQGKYSQLEVNRGLRAPLLIKYFQRAGIKFHVKPELKRMVQPKFMNLVEPWTLRGPFDFVFMRNVLIYFDAATKRTILDRLTRVIAPDGFLFLGGAETTVGVHEGYERMPYPKASCYRLKGKS